MKARRVGSGGRAVTTGQAYPRLVKNALWYASLGYGVLPVVAGRKVPATANGLRDATIDRAIIQAWWTAMPYANVGILPASDVLVLDVDESDRFPDLAAFYPELDAAPLHRTPSGGYHVVVRVPKGWTMPTRVRARPGVDIRGLDRAYVLAPPSVVAGSAYETIRPLVPPGQLPLSSGALLAYLSSWPSCAVERRAVVVPRTAKQRARLRRLAAVALRAETHAVSSAREGTRNDRLNRAAFSLGGFVASGALAEEEVRAALLEAAEVAGRRGHPFSRSEALGTIESGLRAGMEQARVLPAPKLRSVKVGRRHG